MRLESGGFPLTEDVVNRGPETETSTWKPLKVSVMPFFKKREREGGREGGRERRGDEIHVLLYPLTLTNAVSVMHCSTFLANVLTTETELLSGVPLEKNTLCSRPSDTFC